MRAILCDPARRRNYCASCSIVQSRGSLSSRQRTSFVPWRMRSLLVWSNVTSTTSSGRTTAPSISRAAFQRLGSGLKRSPVSYGARKAGSSRFCLAVKPEQWPTSRRLPSAA